VSSLAKAKCDRRNCTFHERIEGFSLPMTALKEGTAAT
jgi:hypothetical protein